MDPSTPSRWRRAVSVLQPGLTQTALLAVLCNLALELSQVLEIQGRPWTFKTPAFVLLFLLGSLVIWMVIGLVHAVVGRIWLTTVVAVTATVLIAVADVEKVRLRREPVYPSDWEFARNIGFLTDMVGRQGILLTVGGIAVLGGAAYAASRALARHLARRPRYQHTPVRMRTRVLVRVLTATACLLGLTYLTNFNSPSNAARVTYEALGASWRPWSQQRNYLGNGFVGGFLYNLDVPPMAAPAGYSEAEMARITSTYTAAAERLNRTRDPRGLAGVNVVMVLSESFSDPTALEGVHLDQDPIPFTRRLMRSTTSGPMLAQNVGGGTANMEFEALTGMSASEFPPQLRVPYQMVVPNHTSFPSAVDWFERTGHRAVAIHPYTTEMYRRREVYRSFGFDDFVYDHKMHEQRRLGHAGYISDESAFDEVRRRLQASSEPMFVNLVTMQNHMPYEGRYDDPVHVTGPDGETLQETGQYVRGLAHTDAALEGLVRGLRDLHEPTVLVFYGDHLPGTYPDDVFAANTRRTLHQTPFFVWASFGGPNEPQPVTSPIHFTDLVLERAGAAVTPYYALLTELRHRVPAMEGGTMFDAADRPLRQRDLSEADRRLLRDYRLVQYDLSVGKRYSRDAMFAQTPAG